MLRVSILFSSQMSPNDVTLNILIIFSRITSYKEMYLTNIVITHHLRHFLKTKKKLKPLMLP